LLEDQLLHEREAAAAVLLGPRETDEAGVEERVLPAAEEFVLFGARSSELPMDFHSRGMFVLSQARTVARRLPVLESVRDPFPLLKVGAPNN